MNNNAELLLDINNLKVHFPIKRDGFFEKKKVVKAVDGISLDLSRKETLGIVGESGCGKSTFARAIVNLVKITDGQVIWQGDDITKFSKEEFREVRKDIQMIFQDPLASLNPRMTVMNIIAEPLRTFYPELTNSEIKEKVKIMMDKVGLLPQTINRYPHEFSGGQCQRIGIARALIVEPKVIICDEPVSALDVSIQAQIINLLKSLQVEMGLSLVFIAHDLSVVEHISDRVAVMYLGHIVEIADSNELFDNPQHPYTKALISAIPIPDPIASKQRKQQLLEGELPSPINPPSGCVFCTRCPIVNDRCKKEVPILNNGNHQTACFLVNIN